jgi:hypothetical protein
VTENTPPEAIVTVPRLVLPPASASVPELTATAPLRVELLRVVVVLAPVFVKVPVPARTAVIVAAPEEV